MKEDHSLNNLDLERIHYDEHRRYLLHFLELDGLTFDRWLIRQVLKTWDRQIPLIKQQWIRGKTVLEAGCGNPRILFYFRCLGAREAIGCDLSKQFVARGILHNQTYVYTSSIECKVGQIRLIYGDVNGPACEGLAVDTVTCFQSLHHLDLPRFAATCHRLLPPGGHVILSDPMGNHPLRTLGNLLGRRSGLLSPGEKALSPQKVIAEFTAQGFELQEYRSLNPTLEIYFQLTELAGVLPETAHGAAAPAGNASRKHFASPLAPPGLALLPSAAKKYPKEEQISL
jgi:SAM-dependent methyltransferase